MPGKSRRDALAAALFALLAATAPGTAGGQSSFTSAGVSGTVTWTYQGCFYDGANGVQGHVTVPLRGPNGWGSGGATNSWTQCGGYAAALGFNVFGLQYGGECWLGYNTGFTMVRLRAAGHERVCSP